MIALVLVLVLQLTPIPFPPIPSPTPIPSSTPALISTPNLPTDNLINTLATAEGSLNNASSDLTNPNGSILPNSAVAGQIFGYSKWLLSTSTAQEIFGPFAPIILSVAAAMTLVIVIGLVYLAIFIATRLIRFVVSIVIVRFVRGLF